MTMNLAGKPSIVNVFDEKKFMKFRKFWFGEQHKIFSKAIENYHLGNWGLVILFRKNVSDTLNFASNKILFSKINIISGQ
jgi:hypothetical protein